MNKKSVGVGLLGLGTVAGQVARVLLQKSNDLAKQVGCPVVLRRVKILPTDLSRPQVKEMDSRLFTTDEDEFFNTPGIDIIVEAIGGEHPALELLTRALASQRHVATSNKEVISKHWAELLSLAEKNGVELRYEASVGGGIPLLSPLQYDLAVNRIKGIYAIINGTTNYILTRMAKEGLDFPTALKQAQKLGYAEADPRNDIEGIDATYKIAILASLAFHTWVRPEQVHCEGISRLTSRDFQYARELGFAIKLLAITKQEEDQVEVRVHPVLIPEDSLLAEVDGVYNAILVEGDLVDKVLFYGQGAGGLPTSSAVVADVLSIATDMVRGAKPRPRRERDSGKVVKPMSQLVTRYYLRMSTADRPGVLAQIARVLGDHRISISSVIQKMADTATQTAEVVIMTHPSPEKGMQAALDQVAHLPVVNEIGSFIRVEY